MPTSTSEKRAEFRRLHQSGCFVIPNPWDIGSARYLQGLGFKALATTSSGLAWSTGRPDNAVGVDEVLAHLATVSAVVDLPINADFEGGYAMDPQGVAVNVARAAATGIAGLSIEDSTGDKSAPLYELPVAVERIKAARAAIDRVDSQVMLVGRAECFLVGRPDLAEVVARLSAYAAAGADCLYAPGLRTRDEISAVVKAVAPKPVNVLVGAPTFAVAELAALGVRRISTGGAMARTAWGEFMRAAKDIAATGTFGGFKNAAAYPELNGFFAEDLKRR